MQTTTLIFNAAGVVLVVGVFVALVDLMQNQTRSYGVTSAPVMVPSPTPSPTPEPVSSAPPAGGE